MKKKKYTVQTIPGNHLNTNYYILAYYYAIFKYLTTSPHTEVRVVNRITKKHPIMWI